MCCTPTKLTKELQLLHNAHATPKHGATIVDNDAPKLHELLVRLSCPRILTSDCCKVICGAAKRVARKPLGPFAITAITLTPMHVFLVSAKPRHHRHVHIKVKKQFEATFKRLLQRHLIMVRMRSLFSFDKLLVLLSTKEYSISLLFNYLWEAP